MELFLYLKRQAGAKLYWIGLLSLMTGVCNALLIKTLNDVMLQGADDRRLMLYLTAIVVYLAAAYLFNRIMLTLTQSCVRELRGDIARRVMAADYAAFERMPNQRVYSAVTDDTTELANAPELLNALLTSLFTTAACFLYLMLLSWRGALTVTVLVAVGSWLYSSQAMGAVADWDRARETEDGFFKSIDHLLKGFRELKLCRAKADRFLQDEVLHHCSEQYRHNLSGGRKFINAGMISGILLFGVLGGFAFSAQSLLGLDQATFMAMMVLLLYMTPSVQGVVDLLPLVGRFDIALERLRSLEKELAGWREAEPTASPAADWRTIQLERVTYTYREASGAAGFQFGPVDLGIDRGEVLFLMGGNGSGKTTLLKLLLGLYQPEAGRVLLDGSGTKAMGRAWRDLFGAVWADFHLFDRLHGQPAPGQEAAEWLKKLELDHKLSLDRDRLSTTALSRGQQKRLAMLDALLDDPPILIFDEPTADQDRAFREVFYNRIIPELKAKGKTIVVVTHDQDQHQVADRVLYMDGGRLSSR